MSKIVLARVDDRLIHGQVMTAWVKHTNGNKIVIVDDATYNDEFMQSILTMSVPSDITLKIYNMDKGLSELSKITNDGKDDRIIVLVKTPDVIEFLIDGGVEIKELIIGGMGSKAGRKVLYKNISASQQEREVLRSIKDKNVEVKIHIIPAQKPISVEKYL